MRSSIVAFALLSLPLASFAAEIRAGQPALASSVDAEQYPAARAPEATPQFKWNFSTKRDYLYKYQQTSSNRMKNGESDTADDSPMKTTGTADLIVRSAGDGTARLVLENIRMKMSMDEQEHEVPQSFPITVIGGLRDDGTLDSSLVAQQSSVKLLFRRVLFRSDGTLDSSLVAQQSSVKLLFPMPPRALAVGEVATIPIEMPVQAAGSTLTLKGVTNLKNTGWVMLGKRLCVELRGETSFEKLKVPEEIQGKYQFTMVARSVFYFEPTEQRFVRGVIASSMSMDVDAPSPLAHMNVEDKRAKENVKMSMTSDELIVLSMD